MTRDRQTRQTCARPPIQSGAPPRASSRPKVRSTAASGCRHVKAAEPPSTAQNRPEPRVPQAPAVPDPRRGDSAVRLRAPSTRMQRVAASSAPRSPHGDAGDALRQRGRTQHLQTDSTRSCLQHHESYGSLRPHHISTQTDVCGSGAAIHYSFAAHEARPLPPRRSRALRKQCSVPLSSATLAA
jgi:hypothetical protein